MKPATFRLFSPRIRSANIAPYALQSSRGSWRRSPSFHTSARLAVVKPYLLADIGEGITECQIIQWFVEPGATVEQFDKICEVQSDKATVEITSRFDGVIKKRYYEADDMARVGKPLVDIDIASDEVLPEDEALLKDPQEAIEPETTTRQTGSSERKSQARLPIQEQEQEESRPKSSGKYATLATPAVRHMIRGLKLSITDIQGTGKDGRVLKEDVQKFAARASNTSTPSDPPTFSSPTPLSALAEDKTLPLTPVQSQMYKTMTRSLSIPHFLYTDSIDFTSLNTARRKLNATAVKTGTPKLSALPFILKAVSLALDTYPTLNAHLDTSAAKPQLIQKAAHNIGVAIDSPSGLLVPVIKNVQSHSILSLAAEIARLSELARAGKLATADLSGATFTVSNIGSIGGGAVAPVIVPPQVGIMAVGKTRAVPAFDADGKVVRREECVLSWSADHRVVDGASVARVSEVVRGLLEDIESLVVRLR